MRGSDGTARTIDNGNVTVPNRSWNLQRISTSTRVIAVFALNSNTVRPGWGTYRTTGNAIEQATEYVLLL